jgi:hypothetical protein
VNRTPGRHPRCPARWFRRLVSGGRRPRGFRQSGDSELGQCPGGARSHSLPRFRTARIALLVRDVRSGRSRRCHDTHRAGPGAPPPADNDLPWSLRRDGGRGRPIIDESSAAAKSPLTGRSRRWHSAAHQVTLMLSCARRSDDTNGTSLRRLVSHKSLETGSCAKSRPIDVSSCNNWL